MKKVIKIIGVALATAMLIGVFGFAGCEQSNPREDVIYYVNELNEAKELKFIVEPNVEHIDNVHTAVQKYDSSWQLVYMYNKMVHRETGEVNTERLYKNGKDFDLLNKTYYEVVLTQNSSLAAMIPDIGLLGLESTTFEKISNDEYLVTIYPQSLLGDMFGDTVFEYTIKIKDNFVSEIRFAGNTASISRNIGEQIIIDESEFEKRV